MTVERRHHVTNAARLAEEFDSSFASAVKTADEYLEDLLAVGIRNDSYAIRVSDIASLVVDKKVTTVPVDSRALLGIAGFRGSAVSVFDLGALLGYESATTSRWMIVTAFDATVALAFDRFEGHLSVTRDALIEDDAAIEQREMLQIDGVMRPIVRITEVVNEITSNNRRSDHQ